MNNVQQPITHPYSPAATRYLTNFGRLQINFTNIVFESGRNRAYYAILYFALLITPGYTLIPWKHLHPFDLFGILLLPLFALQLFCTLYLKHQLLSLYNYPAFSNPASFSKTINSLRSKETAQETHRDHQYNRPTRLLILQLFTLLPVTAICCWNCTPSTSLTHSTNALRIIAIVADLMRAAGTANNILYPFVQDYMNWRRFCRECIINISMGDFITTCQQEYSAANHQNGAP